MIIIFSFNLQVSPYQSPFVRITETSDKLGDLIELTSTLEAYQSYPVIQDIVRSLSNYYPSFNVLCEATIYHTYNKNAGRIVYVGEPPSSTPINVFDWNEATYRKPPPDSGSALKSEASLVIATKFISQLLIFFSLISVLIIFLWHL